MYIIRRNKIVVLFRSRSEARAAGGHLQTLHRALPWVKSEVTGTDQICHQMVYANEAAAIAAEVFLAERLQAA